MLNLNTAQTGKVVPVKITVGCSDNDYKGLKPAIQLLNGDKAPGTETGSDEVETYSSSSVDTAGVMREAEGGYVYNLEVPTKYKDGAQVKAGDLLTIRVRPFGEDKPEASMYVVFKVAK